MNEEISEVMLSGFVNLQGHDKSISKKEDVKVHNNPAAKQVHISF